MKSITALGIKVVLLVAMLGGLTVAGWFGRIIFNNPYTDWWFDEAVWKAQYKVNLQHNPRGKMFSDVEQRILKQGMSRQQVVDVLGPPDDGQSKGETMTYALGGWNALSPYEDTLEIEFDSFDKVTRFYKFLT